MTVHPGDPVGRPSPQPRRGVVPRLPLRLLDAGAILGVIAVLVLAGYLLTKTAVLPTRLRTAGFAPVGAALTREARWQQDLTYLARELTRLHVAPYHSIDRTAFTHLVADLDASLPNLSDDAIVVRLMALVAAIGDGHSGLAYQPLYGGAEGWHLYGLSIARLDDGWYVVGALPELADTVGAQVHSVADLPVEELFERVAPLVSADNEMQRYATAPGLMVTPEVLAALGVVDDLQEAVFALELPDGTTRAVAAPAVDPIAHRSEFVGLGQVYPASAARLALQHPDEWYWFEYLPEEQALFFQYDRCAEMEGKPFAEFTAALFDVVDTEAVERIVVDLRANGGGNSQVLQPFLDGLAERPHLEVYPLIGRYTFSSALMNAIQLDQQANAVLVGEPTGGRPNHYGEVRHFELPHSGLAVSYATKYFRMLENADPPSLMPELVTPLTMANQIAGRDAGLEVALAAGRAE